MTTKHDRILFVDDEQAVLDGLCRQHRKNYALVSACGADAGLRAVLDEGPFAVVVTDFQMPGMNGTQFLARAREHDPDMIRIMLTGQADLSTAVNAVNEGHIFRFLTKPCDTDTLRGCLDDALKQYRLQHVERDMLEQTVRGSIEVMADVLALANPAAFGRATRIRGLVRHIVDYLNLADGWQYETAALLSQIGYVAIPDDLLDRWAAGEELSAAQKAMIDHHPDVARDLLLKIPRLQVVAEIVGHQDSPGPPSADRTVELGGRMLAAALDFEEHLSVGASRRQALDALRKAKGKYDERILEALATVKPSTREVVQEIPVERFRVGMVIDEDVRSTRGTLVVSHGHEITERSLQRLRNHADLRCLEKTRFRVHVPDVVPAVSEPSLP